jgi:hypothetical protein
LAIWIPSYVPAASWRIESSQTHDLAIVWVLVAMLLRQSLIPKKQYALSKMQEAVQVVLVILVLACGSLFEVATPQFWSWEWNHVRRL